MIKGFADSVPIGATLRERFPSNAELSKARADAGADVLRAQAVPAALITPSGLGQAHPVTTNDTAEGRTKNRRFEIDIVEAPS